MCYISRYKLGARPMEKQIALRDANQRFAQYVRTVEAGQSFVITRGRPIARLVPIESGRRVLIPEQQAARAWALERMREGWDLGGLRIKRDELYQR